MVLIASLRLREHVEFICDCGAGRARIHSCTLKGVDRQDLHCSFFDYAPIGKQKLFSEHPVCQRLS